MRVETTDRGFRVAVDECEDCPFERAELRDDVCGLDPQRRPTERGGVPAWCPLLRGGAVVKLGAKR